MASGEQMCVTKRDGTEVPVQLDKITERIRRLAQDVQPPLSKSVDAAQVAIKVCQGIYNKVKTSALDRLAAETAAGLVTAHPDYSYLAARIEISSLHKMTKPVFTDVVTDLYSYVNPKTGKAGPLISEECYKIIMDNAERLNKAVDTNRDYNYDYFGVKTLQRAYLLKINGQIAERPNQMLMRVSVGIHKNDLDRAIQTYDLMSSLVFTHASPTMFNAGTPRPQMSSCFLLTMADDSIEGIYDTLKQCAAISKNAGGIGLSVHKIRAGGSYIRGTNGSSNGLVPMLRVFNNTARYVDQGGGKRKGSFAIYLEPWHADVFSWLELKLNHGKEEDRARDLFYALWIPDLFMKRVEADSDWTLMCPNECPGLADCFGDEFEALYTKYETEGKGRETIKARKLWKEIIDTQQETGTPYMLYKDSCNRKSNQQNLGTIRSSNLCTEILEYTSPDEVAVCNLASIALPRFIKTGEDGKPFYDFEYLRQITKVVTVNLNRVIDANYYPVKEAANSNFKHRPIGIGVQGLADAFMMLKLPFDSKEAQQLNEDIFATIYYGALEASAELAKEEGAYETYGPSEDGTRAGSPMFNGQMQFDMWREFDFSKKKPTDVPKKPATAGGLLDWDKLRALVKEHGVRNSLLLAPMPTASTSQILGNNECFEPYTSNVYVRRTLAGEFIVINKHLLKDLLDRGLWNHSLKQNLIAANGSVQNLPIPQDLKSLYKTVWEISAKTQINMAADRGAYICQSQSFNVHMAGANYPKMTSMHFYAWKRGLKTGMYYLRSKAAVDAIKFTLDTDAVKAAKDAEAKMKADAAAKEETECLNCGS